MDANDNNRYLFINILLLLPCFALKIRYYECQYILNTFNRKFITLFGHPGLANVPNQVTGRQLSQLLKHLMPTIFQSISSQIFKSHQFVMVNAQGKNCSRCIWNSHCYGCIRLDPQDNETKVRIIHTHVHT